jgi:hypothetical protein
VCPTGSIPNSSNTACVKDGSTTPPPPASAPGPNPTDTTSTSYACYSTTTGQPVSGSTVNGVTLCPAGSYGH